MPLLPPNPLALVALAAMIAGTAVILRRGVPRAYAMGLLLLGVAVLQVGGRMFAGTRTSPLGGDSFGDPVTDWLGLRSDAFLRGEEWWAPFSYMFLHADLSHIVGNLFILLTAGPALEERIGSRAFILIYFTAGFSAAAAHVVLTTTGVVGHPFDLAIGASGAIFGVLTAYAVRYPREPLPIALMLILWLPAFVVLLIYLGMNLVFMLAAETGIAWWGHFAGFLVGLAFAARLDKIAPAAAGARRRGLPDAEALRPLATTRELEDLRGKVGQFKGEHEHDAVFAEAWLDKFFGKAACPVCRDGLSRDGLTASCPKGHYSLDFASRAKP